MKKSFLSLSLSLCALSAFSWPTSVSAQTPPPTSGTTQAAPPGFATDAATAALQAQGQQVLDTVPVLNILTNIPASTFDAATFDVYLGLNNTGSQLQSVVGGDYIFKTNFFARAEIGLGASPSVINSAGFGGGFRYAKPTYEFYAGALGLYDNAPTVHAWQVEAIIGAAWKPSSGLAVFAQYGALSTIAGNKLTAPTGTVTGGIMLPF